MADTGKRIDRELEEFRSIMEVPTTFEEGFTWTSFIGAIFIGLVMVPGAMYMSLLAGEGIGPAAQWVTVILFIEVAKRAHKNLKKAELFVLYWMAGAMMAVPFQGLMWNQFFARSDAAVAAGIAGDIPTWWAPLPDSGSYAVRSFMHKDWLAPIALIIFSTFFSQINAVVLGYGLFRVTSDVEKLPFPMAPIGAQGIMALAEDADEQQADNKEQSWRWRLFSMGGAMGLAFGVVYLLLPTLSGALTGTSVQIFPIPWVDWTSKTQHFLPAVATGFSFDAMHFITGMVMPFWAMVGSFVGLVVTMIMNPILYHHDILHSWQTGDDTVATFFKNYMDFYFSFQIGIAIAIFAAGIWQVYRSIRNRPKAVRQELSEPSEVLQAKRDRGDIPNWAVITTYVIITFIYIGVSGYLIDWHRGVMIVLFLLGFVYTPLISYVTARLEGIAGQAVEIPMVKEASLIVSGYQGVKVWFLPIPMANYGMMTLFYRKSELLGTRFKSIWKAQAFLYPVVIVAMVIFANFIWGLAEVPSAVYPYAQKMWPLTAANQSIMYSATLGEYSQFEGAFSWAKVGVGALFGVGLFGVLTSMGSPIFFVYGVVRGLGQSMPHFLIPQFLGALIGHFYFRRKFGVKKWRQYIPVVAAGFACGQGLITVLGVGITFLSKAVLQLPF